jgi:hypothetical protein
MNVTKSSPEVASESALLLSQLEKLLEQQVQLAQHNDFSAVVEVGRQADDIIDQIVRSKILGQKKYKERKTRIEKLYTKLSIIIDVEEKYTIEQLKHVRAGSKFLNTYKSNS